MIKKQVFFEGKKKTFYVGDGQYLTLKNGAILDTNNKFVKMFSSYCVDVEIPDETPKEEQTQLLTEEPIECAEVEEKEDDLKDAVEQIKTKEDLIRFADEHQIEINKRKSISNIKKEILSKI